MSVFQFLRPMFLNMSLYSSGWTDFGFRILDFGFERMFAGESGETFSCSSSLTMQTGAVPQLARHSTNSML